MNRGPSLLHQTLKILTKNQVKVIFQNYELINSICDLETSDLDNDAAADSDLWAGGRQMLRQYLQEVGFTDTILDARSARLRALLGGTGPNDGK